MDTLRMLSALIALAVPSGKERRRDTPMRAITGLALSWILSATSWAGPLLPKYALTEIPSIVAAGGAMSASAINNRDEVVGNATQPGGAPFFGDAGSSANAINNNGEIVGGSVATDRVTSRAFICLNGQIYDLNSLLDTSSQLAGSVKLQEAVGINSHGWIAANGTRDGQQHAYLLKRE